MPTTTSITPASKTAGDPGFTLTMNGTNFVATSVVYWKGSPRTTTFVSATRLTAQISASDLATAGTANVAVNTPAPGGGTSNARTFTVNNPLPTTTGITPTSATAGTAPFTLTVNGTKFVATSVVYWKGSPRTTTFVSATRLTAQISANDLATAGFATVTVRSPSPGGGTSNAQTFTVNNPLSTTTGLAPVSKTLGDPAFTLTVNGTKFAATSVVHWKGSPRTTTVVSATRLTAQISASDLASAGFATVTVRSPSPGGGTSNPQTFTVNSPLPTTTRITPASKTVGDPAFTLTIDGANFVSTSVVTWNGSSKATTFVSATQFTAQISASDLATAGTGGVAVNTPGPGGGTSNAQTFTVNNPLPTMIGITPTSATAGSPAFTLTVKGMNFVPGSVVRLAGAARPTTFASSTEVAASILVSDAATPGEFDVAVFNAPPGGGLSNSRTLTVTVANPAPPCGDIYGSLSDQNAIEAAMHSGTEEDVIAAIDAAKATRGNRVGCAESAYTYTPADFTEPDLADIASTWETLHAPRIATYTIGCPLLARNFATAALGGYYARLAGFSASLPAMAEIATMQEATQYSTATAPLTTAIPGAFGYLRTDPADACYLGTPWGEAVESFCATYPGTCAAYTGGLFAGREFNIADIVADQGVFDGSLAYDHGIAGVMMIEAGLQQTDQALRDRFRASARLAADWAVAEPPVRDHNYTAKLVWLLAGVYASTGDPVYRTALLDKLARGLKPGLLTDFNNDGLVDGMSDQRFEELAPVARTPGRMWDGHNALPWYQAMNASAFIEAYVALRDRGNAAAAAAVKPYALLSLNNLAREINTYGTLVPATTSKSQQSQVLHALLLGLYKIAAYENEPRPAWQTAAAALWNAGTGQSFAGMNTLTTGLYLLYKSGVPWVPLSQRASP